MLVASLAGTPYHGGVWLVYIEFPEDFPRSPPHCRFVTRILHCNINSYGRVCHSILDRNWSSDTKVATVIECIFGLLLAPDIDDPLDSTLALARADDSGAYEGSIVAHTARYAKAKTKEQWLDALLKDDEDDVSAVVITIS